MRFVHSMYLESCVLDGNLNGRTFLRLIPIFLKSQQIEVGLTHLFGNFLWKSNDLFFKVKPAQSSNVDSAVKYIMWVESSLFLWRNVEFYCRQLLNFYLR